MASTYLSLRVHVVFATKDRLPLIANDWIQDLHAYLGGCLKGLGAVPLSVGGVHDHVHLLASLRGTHAVSDLVREVKKSSSVWSAERCDRFAWQEGYGAFSVSYGDTAMVSAYIASQADHHRRVSSADEMLRLLKEHGVEYDSQYFE